MEYDSKLRFLERVFGKSKYHSNQKEAMFICCFCSHRKQKLSINLETDLWHCWVCNNRGRSLYNLIKKVGGSADIREYLSEHKAKSVISPRPDYIDLGFRVSLPKSFNPLVNCKTSFEGERAWNYLTKVRGISEEDILRYKIGIANGNLIFPSFDRKGYLNFYAERTLSGFYVKPNVPRGYVKQIIFNELNLDFSQPMVLTEGFMDVLKTIVNTVPLFGSSLAKDSKLFETIVRHKTPMYMGLDADAELNSDRITRNFIRNGVPVYNIVMGPFKDLGEMTKKESLCRLESASMASERSLYLNKLDRICS